jgi:hypothetical protein
VVGNNGDTAAHVVARNLCLHLLDASVLTEEILSLKNDAGETPGNLMLQSKTSGRLSRLLKAAKDGTLNKFRLTPDDFRLNASTWGSIAHMAAAWGHLDQIPDSLLTDDIMSAKNQQGQTPRDLAALAKNPSWMRRKLLFDAASKGKLGFFELTRGDLLLLQGRTTLAHCAAYAGTLNQVPRHLLTFYILLRKTPGGKTVFSIARKTNCLQSVDPIILQALERCEPADVYEDDVPF